MSGKELIVWVRTCAWFSIVQFNNRGHDLCSKVERCGKRANFCSGELYIASGMSLQTGWSWPYVYTLCDLLCKRNVYVTCEVCVIHVYHIYIYMQK